MTRPLRTAKRPLDLKRTARKNSYFFDRIDDFGRSVVSILYSELNTYVICMYTYTYILIIYIGY